MRLELSLESRKAAGAASVGAAAVACAFKAEKWAMRDGVSAFFLLATILARSKASASSSVSMVLLLLLLVLPDKGGADGTDTCCRCAGDGAAVLLPAGCKPMSHTRTVRPSPEWARSQPLGSTMAGATPP